VPAVVPPKRSREQLLAARLVDLAGLWLSLTCSCGQTVAHPFRTLARRYGGKRLADVLPRLQCDHCKRGPARVSVVNYPAGPPLYDRWTVEVFP
jgi:hypothetical protein